MPFESALVENDPAPVAAAETLSGDEFISESDDWLAFGPGPEPVIDEAVLDDPAPPDEIVPSSSEESEFEGEVVAESDDSQEFSRGPDPEIGNGLFDDPAPPGEDQSVTGEAAPQDLPATVVRAEPAPPVVVLAPPKFLLAGEFSALKSQARVVQDAPKPSVATSTPLKFFLPFQPVSLNWVTSASVRKISTATSSPTTQASPLGSPSRRSSEELRLFELFSLWRR